MSKSDSVIDKRAQRAQYAPPVTLCTECEGHGTLLVQSVKDNWYHRSTESCDSCQSTGLKGIPESEVNKVRL